MHPGSQTSQQAHLPGREEEFSPATGFDIHRVLVWSLVVIGVAALVLAAIT